MLHDSAMTGALMAGWSDFRQSRRTLGGAGEAGRERRIGRRAPSSAPRAAFSRKAGRSHMGSLPKKLSSRTSPAKPGADPGPPQAP